MSWTEQRVERLKALWGEGKAASEIARDLGGITRNAVIGKLTRLGLMGRGNPNAGRGISRKRKAVPPLGETKKHRSPGLAFHGGALPSAKSRAPLPETQAVGEPAKAPDGEPFTVLTIRAGLCKWPIGDPLRSGFHFCGRPAAAGAPYCRGHEARAYQIGAAAESREEKELQRALRRART